VGESGGGNSDDESGTNFSAATEQASARAARWKKRRAERAPLLDHLCVLHAIPLPAAIAEARPRGWKRTRWVGLLVARNEGAVLGRDIAQRGWRGVGPKRVFRKEDGRACREAGGWAGGPNKREVALSGNTSHSRRFLLGIMALRLPSPSPSPHFLEARPLDRPCCRARSRARASSLSAAAVSASPATARAGVPSAEQARPGVRAPLGASERRRGGTGARRAASVPGAALEAWRVQDRRGVGMDKASSGGKQVRTAVVAWHNPARRRKK